MEALNTTGGGHCAGRDDVVGRAGCRQGSKHQAEAEEQGPLPPFVSLRARPAAAAAPIHCTAQRAQGQPNVFLLLTAHCACLH